MFKKKSALAYAIPMAILWCVVLVVSLSVSHYWLSHHRTIADEEVFQYTEELQEVIDGVSEDELLFFGEDQLSFLQDETAFLASLTEYIRDSLKRPKVTMCVFLVDSANSREAEHTYSFYAQIDDTEQSLIRILYNKEEDVLDYTLLDTVPENIEDLGGVNPEGEQTLHELYGVEATVTYAEVTGLEETGLTEKQKEQLTAYLLEYVTVKESGTNGLTESIAFLRENEESTSEVKVFTFYPDNVSIGKVVVYYYVETDMVLIF